MKLSYIGANFIISGILVLCLYSHALADDFTRTLAVIPIKSGNVDKNVYHQFDRLVPELKKISKNKVVKLECRYSGKSDNEQDVQNAYNLAARIEKYLRVRHKLDLDLWLMIDITSKTSQSLPLLTISVFSDDIKRVDTVMVNSSKN